MTLLPANSYRKTRGIIRRGTRANQPVATSVLEGTLYFVTDEGVTERSNGSAWESFSGFGGSVSISNIPVLMPFVTEYEEAEIPYIIPGPRGIDGVAGSAGINGINGINGRIGLDGIDGENTEIIIQSPNNIPLAVPGGSSGQVQFNNGGVFGGDADLTFSGDTLIATKIIAITSIESTGDVTLSVFGTKLRIGYNLSITQANGESPVLQTYGTDSRAGQALLRCSANSQGAGIYIGKSRTATLDTTRTIVQSGDELGRIVWSGDDGTDVNTPAATISAFVDGTPGVNNMPGILAFATTAVGGANPTDRMYINSAGKVGIGTITVPSLLTVNGPINLKNYTVATLPAGTRGDIAYVTDALAPSFLAVLVGGGTVVTPCFYNGANWVGF